MKALQLQGKSRDDLPYKAPFQPWGSWFALGATTIITFFKGFDTFLPWNTANFITYVIFDDSVERCLLTNLCRSYIAIPVFFFLWAGYKLFMKTSVIPLSKVDLVTGLKEIDDEEKRYLDEQARLPPKGWLGRLWDSL
jgi:amino acid transporter